MISSIVQLTFRPLQGLKTLRQVDLKTAKVVTRLYGTRWTSRRPAAIVNEDELFDSEGSTPNNLERKVKVPRSRKRASARKIPQADEEKKKSKIVTILKDNDYTVTSLMTKAKTRKGREKANIIFLEGYRLMKDAIDAGVEPKAIFFSRTSDAEKLSLPADTKLYKVPYRTIQVWSNLTTSPGLMGIFKTPDVLNKNPSMDSLPLTIVCDNIREPGNLGTILRAAAGVGCERLILLKGCVDLWDPKVLRSASGTHFRVPISTMCTWEEVPSLISEHSKIYITDSNFGSEHVPEDATNSLKSESNISDSEKIQDEEDDRSSNPKSLNDKELMKEFMSRLPVVPYYSVDYTQSEIVIIVSGETEGLSIDSSRFLHEKKGIRVNIPLTNGVDSLNTGTALGIVTFEIKRQFVKKQSELE